MGGGTPSGPTTGSIQVNSTPTGANIFLDGTDTGLTTNATLTDITPGSHTLKLAKEGYEDHEETVNVTAGQTTTVNTTLVQIFDGGYQFISMWGSQGSGNGQFSSPMDVTVDEAGNVYVIDSGNNRVQKFTSAGSFITKWGNMGRNAGEFDGLEGIAVGPDGNVYTTENTNNRIQKFTSEGTFVTQWGGGYGNEGVGDGEFNSPRGIDVSNDNFVYVVDRLNHRIQKFTSGGTFVAKWGSDGNGNGEFDWPEGISVNNTGNVFVADTLNNRIQIFGYVSSARQSNDTTHFLLNNRVLKKDTKARPELFKPVAREKLKGNLNRVNKKGKKPVGR